MNDFLILIFQFFVFIFSVMVHEVSHGLTAYRLGDDTAKRMNRLNLNPLNHIDPVGSIILPGLLLIMQSPILFGWAKPVPYNPYNLKNPKTGAALIGIAGPLSNLSLALIFGILSKLIIIDPYIRITIVRGAPYGDASMITSSTEALLYAFSVIVFINIMLAVFNLLPIPPLDGSKILFAVLPHKYYKIQQFLEENGMLILIFFILFGFGLIQPIISGLYLLFSGIS